MERERLHIRETGRHALKTDGGLKGGRAVKFGGGEQRYTLAIKKTKALEEGRTGLRAKASKHTMYWRAGRRSSAHKQSKWDARDHTMASHRREGTPSS